jgi:hypothetical protein
MNKRFLAVPAALLLLAGCNNDNGLNGGGGPPGTNADPGGIYEGTAVNPATGTTDDVVGLVDENGEAAFIDLTNPTILRFDPLATNGSDFNATFRGYALEGLVFPDGTSFGNGSATGVVAESDSLTGTFAVGGSAALPFSLSYQRTLYETPHPFSEVAGEYQFPVFFPAGSVSFSVDSAGNIDGFDSFGCTYTGVAHIPDSRFNAFEIAFTENCGGTFDNFTGLAAYMPGSAGAPDELVIEYDDGVNIAQGVIAGRQPPAD